MNKKDYSLVRFEKSKKPQKKYDAILKNKKTKKIVRVPYPTRPSSFAVRILGQIETTS